VSTKLAAIRATIRLTKYTTLGSTLCAA
jgi:hypothetical protein